MIEFVNLMEGVLLKLDEEDEKLEEYWQSDGWTFEPIVNGKRYQILIDENKNVSFWGKIKKYKNPIIEKRTRHIEKEIKEYDFPPNTLLDGIIVFENNFKKTIQLLEVGDDTDIELQKEWGKLIFIIYDIIYCNDEEIHALPYFDRRKKLEELMPKNKIFVKLTESYIDNKFEMYQNLKDKFNIFSFKKVDSQYIFGVSFQFKLMKEIKKYFVIVTGIKEGTGRFENMCGMLEIAQMNKNGELIKMSNVGGITFDERIDFFNNQKKFIGKVAQIKAREKSKEMKKFLDARFDKFRFDKNPEDCIFEEE